MAGAFPCGASPYYVTVANYGLWTCLSHLITGFTRRRTAAFGPTDNILTVSGRAILAPLTRCECSRAFVTFPSNYQVLSELMAKMLISPLCPIIADRFNMLYGGP